VKSDRHKPTTSLFDRVAIAFGSAVIAFLTAGLVWLTIAGFNLFGSPIAFLPSGWIWWFTVVMATLGFVRMENYVAVALNRAWRFIAAMWGSP